MTDPEFERIIDEIKGEEARKASPYFDLITGDALEPWAESLMDDEEREIRRIVRDVSAKFRAELKAVLKARRGSALAAAASGGDVKQAPGEAPQSGGDQPQRPTSIVEGN